MIRLTRPISSVFPKTGICHQLPPNQKYPFIRLTFRSTLWWSFKSNQETSISCLPEYWITPNKMTVQRCARVENPGEWGSSDFCQNPWGDQGFPNKIARGSPILGFILYLLSSFLIYLLLYTLTPSPPCVHLCDLTTTG
jgi:hypothetical protein